jgi:hypothetical protein
LDNEEKQSLNEAGAAADETSTEVRGTVLRTMHQILINRWAEVTMVVVLNAGMMVWLQYLAWEMGRQERSTLEKLSNAAGFFLGMGTMALGIVTQMLMLGFLASVVHEGPRRQEPTTLLLAGRYFFWRWIRFLILNQAILFGGMVICYEVLNTAVLHVKLLTDMPYWAHVVSWMVPVVLLTKLALVVPAEMIVRNRMVFASIQSMREISLFWMKALVGVYLLLQGGIIWMGGWMPQEVQADWKSIATWSGRAAWMAVGQFTVLLWAVLEVKEIRRPQAAVIPSDAAKGQDA